MQILLGNYWFVLLVTLAISTFASLYVNSTYRKYDKVNVGHHVTANEFIQWMFNRNDVTDVSIQHISGDLTDNYAHYKRTISLSDSTFGRSSVAAIGVAAHECGHAVQYRKNYFPVHLRTIMVPVVNIGSNLGLILCIIGAFLTADIAYTLTDIGLALYSLAFLFTVVTLPVEINASRRAIANVRDYQYFSNEEVHGMKKVLTAAALTYVASMVVALLNLLRIITIFGGRRRN